MASKITSRLGNPRTALLVGALSYSCVVFYMFNNYFRKSSVRQIFISSDSAYENYKLMQHP
ncbi:Piso0_005095 [Millerozyma farinosa CBS 7064]|uniref:Piso0_005095 protein n=1 Tax=Pichia sorbitophila (strain ATCC MYA-4447 / BCRC 22081 / CBS 7064 / NBRC 10061 / NRRL Y-12695) TaxID=559304 RepID=G8Y479_PICSO|nr:Piso0_005095 [Millerozyma farinosa CBS 7064]